MPVFDSNYVDVIYHGMPTKSMSNRLSVNLQSIRTDAILHIDDDMLFACEDLDRFEGIACIVLPVCDVAGSRTVRIDFGVLAAAASSDGLGCCEAGEESVLWDGRDGCCW